MLESRIGRDGAVALGLLVLVLAAGSVPLAILAHQYSPSSTLLIATSLVFASVGVVVARHHPRNPLGWLLLGQAALFELSTDAALYAVLHFRLGYHLPLGRLAVILQPAWAPGVVLLGLSVLVLPDGTLPSPRWRWIWRSLVVLGALCTSGAIAIAARTVLDDDIRIDPGGGNAAFDHATGLARWWAAASFVFFVLLCLTLVSWLVAQLAGYRRATGERRLQLKWLLSGAAVFVISALVSELVTASGSDVLQVVGDVASAAQVALPLSMGVAILKFQLYEIDRLISRTVSYAIITSLLAAVLFGIVTLSTDVLPFSSPVGVAVSTLVVVALFDPLRRRVQHAVDRRFNRARYDADATVAAFVVRLRHAVELDTISNELVQTIEGSLEPAHTSLWTVPIGR